MLEKNKIILMTSAASYEQNEGKEDIAINSYFRGDYIGMQILKAAIYGTIGFVAVFAMYILYDLADFMANFYKMDIAKFMHDVLSRYVIFLVVYMIISYFVAAYKYARASKHINVYKEALRRLYSYYADGK